MKDCNPTICRKIDNKIIQMEGEIYWEVDTIAFRFYWTIKNLGENLYTNFPIGFCILHF